MYGRDLMHRIQSVTASEMSSAGLRHLSTFASKLQETTVVVVCPGGDKAREVKDEFRRCTLLLQTLWRYKPKC